MKDGDGGFLLSFGWEFGIIVKNRACSAERVEAMENGAIFRGAMFGFNKEDVITYMEHVSAETEKTLAEAQQQNEELRRTKEELEKKCEDLQQQYDAMCCEVEQLRQEKQQEEELLQLPQAETLEQVRQQREELRVQVQTLTAELEQYRSAQQEQEMMRVQLQEERQQLAQEKNRIGDAIVRSQGLSDEIVADARKQADEIVQAAQDHADGIRRQHHQELQSLMQCVSTLQQEGRRKEERIKLSLYDITQELERINGNLDELAGQMNHMLQEGMTEEELV